MARFVLSLSLLLAATGPLPAEDLVPERVLTWFHLLRPAPSDLLVYQLDWATSLNSAQKRAKAEGRPICLVVIHAKYGNIASGHC